MEVEVVESSEWDSVGSFYSMDTGVAFHDYTTKGTAGVYLTRGFRLTANCPGYMSQAGTFMLELAL